MQSKPSIINQPLFDTERLNQSDASPRQCARCKAPVKKPDQIGCTNCGLRLTCENCENVLIDPLGNFCDNCLEPINQREWPMPTDDELPSSSHLDRSTKGAAADHSKGLEAPKKFDTGSFSRPK